MKVRADAELQSKTEMSHFEFRFSKNFNHFSGS
jgi:hypothetical protein